MSCDVVMTTEPSARNCMPRWNVRTDIGFVAMTIVRMGGAWKPRYEPGTKVYMRGLKPCPCVVRDAVIGFADCPNGGRGECRDTACTHRCGITVYCVETLMDKQGIAWRISEDALTNIRVRVDQVTFTATPSSRDGAVSVHVGNGKPPYDVSLCVVDGDEPRILRHVLTASSVTFDGLEAGQYVITATDEYGFVGQNGCYVNSHVDDAASATHGIEMCTACMSRPRECVYMPCRHVFGCLECTNNASRASAAPNAPRGFCPICRALITGIVRISKQTVAERAILPCGHVPACPDCARKHEDGTKRPGAPLGTCPVCDRVVTGSIDLRVC